VPTAIEAYSSCHAEANGCSYRATHPSPIGGAVKANACHSPTYR